MSAAPQLASARHAIPLRRSRRTSTTSAWPCRQAYYHSENTLDDDKIDESDEWTPRSHLHERHASVDVCAWRMADVSDQQPNEFRVPVVGGDDEPGAVVAVGLWRRPTGPCQQQAGNLEAALGATPGEGGALVTEHLATQTGRNKRQVETKDMAAAGTSSAPQSH